MDSITRHRERARSDRDALYAVLDAVSFGTLATVSDGLPWVVPLLFARDGDRVLLHGSTGAGALRHVAAGAPVALCVTALDGIVVADSTFDSSANYRSAVVRGTIEPIEPTEATEADAQSRALRLLSEKIIPGRSLEVRPNTDREYAATLALALPIRDGQWTVKVRTGGPTAPDPPRDVHPDAGPALDADGDPDAWTGAWTGVVPMLTTYGPPVPSPWLPPDLPVPASVATLVGAR